jgi:hypothetical protein
MPVYDVLEMMLGHIARHPHAHADKVGVKTADGMCIYE